MGHFGRITSVRDLPSDRCCGFSRSDEAERCRRQSREEAGADEKTAERTGRLCGGPQEETAARKAFDAFSPSHRREYVEWITEAKTDATRQKRMATAVEWLAEGKSRNWKYEPK